MRTLRCRQLSAWIMSSMLGAVLVIGGMATAAAQAEPFNTLALERAAESLKGNHRNAR
jgi:Na+/glutamate symporter